jgi:carbamoyltransferase
MWCLGLNGPPAGWHDTAACLVDGTGEVVAFAEEERFNRERHSVHRGPAQSTRFCLARAGIDFADLDVVAIGWDTPALYPDRFADDADLLRHIVGWPDGLPACRVVHVPHHLAHAVSAFHASPFEQAGVLVADGNGESEGTTCWHFRAGRPPVQLARWSTLDSLGFGYDAASRWLGFSFLDAGKTMGLAAYGRAAAVAAPELARLDGDGYRLAITEQALRDRVPDLPRRQRYEEIIARWLACFTELTGVPGPAWPGGELQHDPAAVLVAWAAQSMVESVIGHLAELTRTLTGTPALCLSGGVALNCSTNGLLAPPLYVPPMPHDAGVALGAAWYVAPPLVRRQPFAPYLGSEPGPGGTADNLKVEDLDLDVVAAMLLDGQVGALVEGRSEVGPRALCHRSILALPRPDTQHRRLNAIKSREPWRPFGPVARAAGAASWWSERAGLSHYMVGAAPVTALGQEVVPAAVHVDGTTRPQTILTGYAETAGALLDTLARAGAPPVLVNTSFNRRGEPIVDTTEQAVEAFLAMDLDFLVLGPDRLVRRTGGYR